MKIMSDLSIPRDDSFWLNSKNDVALALKSLYYGDTLITIFYRNIFCLSTVVNYSDDYLWLDIAANKEDGDLLLSKPEIYLKAQHASIPLFMELTEGTLVQFDEKPTWRFKLPSRVHKMQRRDAFRVHFPIMVDTKIQLSNCPNIFKMVDLSLTGIGLLTDETVNVTLGEKYPLHIEFPSFKGMAPMVLDADVLIKSLVSMPNEKKKVGVQLYKLNRTQEVILTKWQHQLQILESLSKKDEK